MKHIKIYLYRLYFFAMILSLVFLVPSCFTFESQKYKTLLNDKMEEIRKNKKTISRLQRENRVLFDRNLDLEKDRQLLSIQLKRTKRKLNETEGKLAKLTASSSKEIANLKRTIEILRKTSEEKVKELVALHRKERGDMVDSYKKEIDEQKKRISALTRDLEKKEKDWAMMEFALKKDVRNLKERIDVLEKNIKLTKEKTQQLHKMLSQLLSEELKKNVVQINIGPPLELWVDNSSMYKPFLAEWNKIGLEIVHKLLDQARSHQNLISDFQMEIIIYTSPRWISHKKAAANHPKIAIGPPPQEVPFSEEGGANLAFHELDLGRYPFPVALSSLRVWLWEDLMYNYFPSIKDFRLMGVPKPQKASVPWHGATRIVFHYKTESKF